MEIIWLILQKFRNILLTVCIGAVFAAIVGWNIIEVQRLSGDWIFAGKIVQQSIYGIKQETYPPLNVKTFYIINMPIRYGRAWIYPTGMTDAIWHMFRNNPYTVSMSPDLPTAFSSPFNGDREVFIFDNYIMKRGIQDTREVQK